MNLTGFRNKHIDSDNKIKSWLFFRYLHYNYITSYPKLLCEILNEYLNYAYCKGLRKYSDRFNNKYRSSFYYLQQEINTEHLTFLKKEVSTDPSCKNLSSKDYNEMIEFYDNLLEYVDKSLGIKFMHNDKFDKRKKQILMEVWHKRLYALRPENDFRCAHKIINVKVPKDFSIKKFRKNSKFEGKVEYVVKDNIKTITFYCQDNHFYPTDFLDLKLCFCTEMTGFDIDWKASDDDVLFIDYEDTGLYIGKLEEEYDI